MQWLIPWMRPLPFQELRVYAELEGKGETHSICLSLYMRFCGNTALPIHSCPSALGTQDIFFVVTLWSKSLEASCS